MKQVAGSPFLPSGNELAAFVEAEVARIEANPEFARSPKIRQLLRYLVDKSLSGEARLLKSYTIAVEGLGRPADFDTDSDSYPRVQVARLRRMLESHYATSAALGGVRLAIAPGSYTVDFGIDAPGFRRSADSADDANCRQPVLRSYGAAIAILIGLILIAATAAWNSQKAAESWRQDNFPRAVVLPIEPLDGTIAQRAHAVDLRQALVEEMSRYESIVVAGQGNGSGDYLISGSLRLVRDGVAVRTSLLDAHGNARTVIWSREHQIPLSDGRYAGLRELARALSAEIAQPAGLIHSHSRSNEIAIGSPYGCWLALMDYWHGRADADRQPVVACTDRWLKHRKAAAEPHAAKAWLISEAAAAHPEPERAKQIDTAWALASQAVRLDPGSTTAQYARMHVALQRGDYSTMQDAADRLMDVNPHNPSLAATVAIHRILAGDDSADTQLRAAIARHRLPPPWLHIGCFLSAVARDDPQAALVAARAYRPMRRRSTGLALLAMAHWQIGQRDAATASWRRAVELRPSLANQPLAAFAGIPMSPQLVATLEQWARPLAEARLPRR